MRLIQKKFLHIGSQSKHQQTLSSPYAFFSLSLPPSLIHTYLAYKYAHTHFWTSDCVCSLTGFHTRIDGERWRGGGSLIAVCRLNWFLTGRNPGKGTGRIRPFLTSHRCRATSTCKKNIIINRSVRFLFQAFLYTHILEKSVKFGAIVYCKIILRNKIKSCFAKTLWFAFLTWEWLRSV